MPIYMGPSGNLQTQPTGAAGATALNPAEYMKDYVGKRGMKTPGALAYERERATGATTISAATQELLRQETQAKVPIAKARQYAQAVETFKKLSATAAPDVRAYMEKHLQPETARPWAFGMTPKDVKAIEKQVAKKSWHRALKTEGWSEYFKDPTPGIKSSQDIWVQKDAQGQIIDYSIGTPSFATPAWKAAIRQQSITTAQAAEDAKKQAAMAAEGPVIYFGNQAVQGPVTYYGVQAGQGQFAPSREGMQWVGMTAPQVLTSPSSVEVGMGRYETLGNLSENAPVPDVTVKALDAVNLPAKPVAKSFLASILPLVGIGAALWLLTRKRRRK